MPVQPTLNFTLTDLPAQFASAGAVATAMAVGMYAPVRLLPPAFVLGGLGYVGLVSLDNALQSPALIAVVIGLFGQLYAVRRRLPALAIVLRASSWVSCWHSPRRVSWGSRRTATPVRR